MFRFVIMISLLTVGCVATLPADPSISADLATEAARMVVSIRQGLPPLPAPTPGPKPGDVCSFCEGRGYIGDRAAIRIECEQCRGTGRVIGSVLTTPCEKGKCKPTR